MRTLSAMGFCLIVLALSPGVGYSAPPKTAEEACAVLQVTVGPFIMGSFCDPGNINVKGWYVFALHAHPRGYDFENDDSDNGGYYLVGWFAVNKSTGSVHNFDITEKKVGALFKAAD